jgi:hypothetical protein
MLWSAVVVLLALWTLGVVFSYTLGGLLHLLLVVAAAFLLAALLSRRADA